MKISVITINYNNATGLRKTAASVLGQTYADFEYLIIDGGSTDGSREIAEELAPRLGYWCSETDGGIYNAMNKGVGHAKGDYLLFLNSGDTLSDAKVLESIARELDGTDIVYGNLLFRYPRPKKDFYRVYPDELTAGFFLKDSLPHPASFIRRKLLVDTPYNETYRIVADWEFFCRKIVIDNCSTRHVDLCVADFAVDGVSADHSKADAEKEFGINSLFAPKLRDALCAQGATEACGLTDEIIALGNTRKLRKRLRGLLKGLIRSVLYIDNALKRH
jgi:glycosyltransferase